MARMSAGVKKALTPHERIDKLHNDYQTKALSILGSRMECLENRFNHYEARISAVVQANLNVETRLEKRLASIGRQIGKLFAITRENGEPKQLPLPMEDIEAVIREREGSMYRTDRRIVEIARELKARRLRDEKEGA